MKKKVNITKEDLPILSRKFTSISKNIDKIICNHLYCWRKDKNDMSVDIKEVNKHLEIIKNRVLEIEDILEKYNK